MTGQNMGNAFAAFADAMAEAAAKVGAATVMVDARRRLPASGVVYASDLILTADHAVERDEDVSVAAADGTQIPAQVAGRDPGSDLAVLRLEKGLGATAQPSLRDARVGELVLALGRPSLEGIQASLGVVSAMGGPIRTGRGGLLERYLRTDAVPYPGFSGGPLVSASGQILGINTSGLARGASLVVPVKIAWQVAETLAQHGQVRRGYLGIRSQPVKLPEGQRQALSREQAVGLLIVSLEDGGPAARGGLLVGDILVGLNGHPISDPDELLSRLTGTIVGQASSLEVLRGGQPVELTITIGER